MAKKENAYSMFVKEEFNRLKKSGQNVAYNSLFSKLSSQWKATPQDKKDQYRQRAADWNSNGPLTQSANPQPFQPRPPTSFTVPPQPRKSEPSEPSEPSEQSNIKIDVSHSFCDTKEHVERKFKPVPAEDIDPKPVIKQEQGVKRDLEVGLFIGNQGQNQDQTQDESEEQPRKRWKEACGIGKGFPNLKNLKTAPDSDSERYFHYHLLQMRTQCESIVSTRAASLLDTPIYTFSCNVLCKYKNDASEIKYVPLEIGPPPRNHWNETNDHMLATHKIKVTKAGVYPQSARNDYHSIYKEMLKYTNDGERTILVADNHDLEQARMCIEWLHEMAEKSKVGRKYSKPSTWTILPLIDFVVAAYNYVHCNILHYPLPKFTLHYYLKVRLETSIWDYEPDLMCPYHKRIENQTKWCARNCSIRVINALQMTFEQIFKNYTMAEDADNLKRQQETAAQESAAREAAARDVVAQGMQNHEVVTSNSDVPEPERIPAQQRQQPMHMPEEGRRPPIIEEMIRNKEKIDELLRQQQRIIETNYD